MRPQVSIEELKRRLYLHKHQFKKWVRLNDLYEVRPTTRTFHASTDLVEAVRRVVKQKEEEEKKNEP